MNLVPMTRREWQEVVREVDMPPTAKLVAFCLATYANYGNGANARPGRRRLALECGVSQRTVERQLAYLQRVGLLIKTFDGQTAGRRGLASVYQLAIAEDLPERVRFVNQTADTGDESSPAEVPTAVADVPTDLPTPATRTSDTSSGTPDTSDAELPTPVSTHLAMHHTNNHQANAPTRPLRRALATAGTSPANENPDVEKS